MKALETVHENAAPLKNAAPKDTWKPEQYNRFKAERAQPFRDLMALVRKENIRTAVDLGCGTGELTRDLHRSFAAGARTLGVDRSSAMLADAPSAEPGLEFREVDIAAFVRGPADTVTPAKFDLVFSNAALQWLPDHARLMPEVFSLVAPGGQVAIQVPANFDHVSHRTAAALAREFGLENDGARKGLPLERYAELLERAGFHEQRCRMEVYMHRMASGADVVEWTKGTLLTAYQQQMTPEQYEIFLAEYRARLLAEIGEGPYAYAFKRFLIWGQRHA